MKRTEMVSYLNKLLNTYCHFDEVEADEILEGLENMGMLPPPVDNDKYQALAHVYVDPSSRVWDEDFFKDEKVAAVYNKRLARQK